MRHRAHAPLQLFVVLAVLLLTVDDEGRPSLMPAEAHAASPSWRAPTPASPPSPLLDEPRGGLERSPVAPGLDEAERAKLGRWGVAYLPSGFRLTANGEYDLVLHFHGGSQIVEPLFQSSGVNAVLVTVNLGVGSRAYRAWAADPQALARALADIDGVVASRFRAQPVRLGRLALSSWSAGYGAVAQLLAQTENQRRVDAVLLADGIHAPFVDPSQRRVAPRGMSPFVRFARSAQAGEKLMLLTHSEIQTAGYASTTETATFLVDDLALPRTSAQAGPVGNMKPITQYERGGVRVTGFAGNDAAAHCEHLRHLDETMLAPLRARWTESA